MKNIQNIIFDYGNVIFEIDFKITQSALVQLGITNIDAFFGHKTQHEIFNIFEKGNCSAAQFRDEIRKITQKFDLTDQQIDSVWNSLLVGIPQPNIHQTLLEVKQQYRTFLLSNNNEIHYNWIMSYLNEHFNLKNYDTIFEKAYFSHLMKMRKPDVEIFETVLQENKLQASQTLFIDDSPQHIEGAKKAGLHALLMDEHPRDLRKFLLQNGIL